MVLKARIELALSAFSVITFKNEKQNSKKCNTVPGRFQAPPSCTTWAYRTFCVSTEFRSVGRRTEWLTVAAAYSISTASRWRRDRRTNERRHVNMSREESSRINPQQLQQQLLTVGRETSARRGGSGSRRSSWTNAADDFDRKSTLSLRIDVDGVESHSRTHSINKKPSGLSLKSSWRLKYQDFIPDISITLKSEPFQ